jgi:hypothetical protein
MEIVRIFAPHLYAIQYDPNGPDEFDKLFKSWNDIEYLEGFFEKNKEDLQSDFFEITTVEDAVISTRSQAKDLEKKLKTLSESSNKELAESLDTLFRPLNKQLNETELEKSKAYGIAIEKAGSGFMLLKLAQNYTLLPVGQSS